MEKTWFDVIIDNTNNYENLRRYCIGKFYYEEKDKVRIVQWKAFAIVVPTIPISMAGFKELKESYEKYGHEEGIEEHHAVELEKVERFASGNGLEWNYPWGRAANWFKDRSN